MKLVVSSATKTMRKGYEDLDYSAAFQNKFNNNKFLGKKILNLNIKNKTK